MSLQFGVSSRMFRGHAIAASAIPDSGILHEWPTTAGSGSTVTDTSASADIALSDAQWDTSTNSWWDGSAVLYDGVDDYGVVNANRLDPGSSGTWVTTVHYVSDSGSTFQNAFSHLDTDNLNNLFILRYEKSYDRFEILVGETSPTFVLDGMSMGQTYRVGVVWDGTTATAYLNGSPVGSSTIGGVTSLITKDWYFGAEAPTSNNSNVIVDYPRISTDAFSDQQMADDHDAQPWV